MIMAPTADAFAKRRRLTAQSIIYGRSDILRRVVESAPKLNGSHSFNPARREEPEEKQPESTPGMERDMSKGSPIKLILFFTLPLLAGNIFQQFYSMVDTFVVGRFVGVDALAALGTTSAMAFLVLGFVGGLTAGFSVIISQRFGAGDPDGMRSATAMSIITAFGLTIILTVVSMATSMPLLRLLRTPANIIEDANTYISILFAGILTTVYYNLFASMLRALGDSRSPLYFLLIASILNIVLDLVFVINLGLGCAGVGYATVISQGVSALFCLLYIHRKYPQLHLTGKDWKLDKVMIARLLRIGIPSALQFSVCAIGVMIVQACINGLGSDAVAAYSVGCKVENLITQPLVTLGMAMATYAGQNLGAGRLDRIRKGAWHGTLLCIGFAVIGLLVILLCGEWLVGLFVEQGKPQVIADANLYLRLVSIFFIPLGLIFIFRNTCQGAGSGLIPLLSSLQELLFRALVAVTLVAPLGYLGICLASPIAWVAAAALLLVAYALQMKHLEKRGFQRGTPENV